MFLKTVTFFFFLISFILSYENNQYYFFPISFSIVNPDIYWINLDRSTDRKARMENTVKSIKLNGFRVRGLEPAHIYLPPNIEKTWPGAWC